MISRLGLFTLCFFKFKLRRGIFCRLILFWTNFFEQWLRLYFFSIRIILNFIDLLFVKNHFLRSFVLETWGLCWLRRLHRLFFIDLNLECFCRHRLLFSGSISFNDKGGKLLWWFRPLHHYWLGCHNRDLFDHLYLPLRHCLFLHYLGLLDLNFHNLVGLWGQVFVIIVIFNQY